MNPGKGEALPASRPVAQVIDIAGAYLANVIERDARSEAQLAADLIHLRHAIDLLEVEFSRDCAAFAAGDEYVIPPTGSWSRRSRTRR